MLLSKNSCGVAEAPFSQQFSCSRMGLCRSRFLTEPCLCYFLQLVLVTLHTMNCNVFYYLLDGCEPWRLTREDLARLEVFHMSCCRRILKVYWWTKTSKDEVFGRSKQRAVIEMIEVRRWRYLGHSLHRKNSIHRYREGSLCISMILSLILVLAGHQKEANAEVDLKRHGVEQP